MSGLSEKWYVHVSQLTFKNIVSFVFRDLLVQCERQENYLWPKFLPRQSELARNHKAQNCRECKHN
jgi:hypothetical protein